MSAVVPAVERVMLVVYQLTAYRELAVAVPVPRLSTTPQLCVFAFSGRFTVVL